MKKRIICLVFALIAFLCVLTFSAYATEQSDIISDVGNQSSEAGTSSTPDDFSEEESDVSQPSGTVGTVVQGGIEYYIDGDALTAEVTGITDKQTASVVLVSSFSFEGKKYTVSGIRDGAFADLSGLKSVYIPCTVTEIGIFFDNLTEITVKSCNASGASAFALSNGCAFEADSRGYEDKVIDPPTCSDEGASILTCPHCLQTYGEEKKIDPAHNYGDWIITTPPSDDEEGERERTCGDCGHKDTETLIKTNCQHTDTGTVDDIIKEATCKEVGSKNILCKYCGQTVFENVEIPKAKHSFGAWTVTKQPTQKENGTRVRSCNVCATVEEETLLKVDCLHANTENRHQAPSCTKNGYDMTYCKDCGKTISQTTLDAQHTEGETETKEATCTENGYIIQKCSVCGEEMRNEAVEATGHSYGDWTVLIEATVTSDGMRAHTCGVCSQTENEIIPKRSDSEVSEPTSDGDTGEEVGTDKTVFIVIGGIVILLTVGYITVTEINKRRFY